MNESLNSFFHSLQSQLHDSHILEFKYVWYEKYLGTKGTPEAKMSIVQYHNKDIKHISFNFTKPYFAQRKFSGKERERQTDRQRERERESHKL